jgi:hypothetical protein
MEVLIISKTHMTNAICIGGVVLANNQYVRLLNRGNKNQPIDTEIEIGQIWEINFISRNPITAPHNEDVIVLDKTYLRNEPDTATFIKNRGLVDWVGTIESIFEGLLHWTKAGSAYIDPLASTLPKRSAGFWISDKDLYLYNYMGASRYRYPKSDEYRGLKFVGFQPVINIIPAGTIIGVSLTRPFTMNGVQGLWLQLSGWYDVDNGSIPLK